MPEIQTPLPQQTVMVEFDPESFELRVFPETLLLIPGSLILWEFSSVPAGFYPWIQFETENDTNFGPFPTVSRLSQTLLGQVPKRVVAGLHHYRLLLRSRIGITAQAGHAAVWSQRLTMNLLAPAAENQLTMPPTVTVKPEGNNLVVSPEILTLTSASEVMVAFVFDPHILSDDLGPLEPRIEFLDFTPVGQHLQKSPPLGPFSSLIFDGTRLWGSGDAGRRGHYSYMASVLRRSTGELVWASSTDPVIDDQREPPP